MKKILIFVIPVFLFLGPIIYVEAAGYAWGENVGWLDTTDMVVSDTSVSGYLYSGNFGWINLNCSNDDSCSTVDFGITNNSGVLSGYAWGENVGWLDFSEATINTSTSEFSGYIYSGNVGWISLNCSNNSSCSTVDYSVSTSWTPSSAGSSEERMVLYGYYASRNNNTKISKPLSQDSNKTIDSDIAPRNLSVGDTGEDVKFIQKIMNAFGYEVAENGPGSPGNETNFYGPLTKNAVIRFQTDMGIYPNQGVFGPQTKTGLVEIAKTIDSDDVKFIQKIMNAFGYEVAENGPGSPGNETNFYGPLTKNAVIRFQTDMGIYPNQGVFGPQTKTGLVEFIINSFVD